MSIFTKSLRNLKKNIVTKKIIKAIKKHQTIVCLRHEDADPDAIGSQHGLAEIIKNTYPDKKVYCLGENQPSLNWLGTSDDDSKVDFKHTLIFVTDCPDFKRISGSTYLKSADDVIKIDHHPLADKFANLAWINPKKSSACEMICDLALADNPLKLDKRSAELLYAGIIGDTGRFMFPGSTSHTFYDVAKLASFGIDLNKINRKETETDIGTTHLYGYLDLHLHMLKNGTAYYVVTKKMMNHFNITPDDFISKNVPGNIKGVVAWAMFTEAKDNILKISLRSHAPAINGLAKKYNGGGHALASGARIYHNHDTKANVKKVVSDLSKLVDSYNQNKNN